MTSPSQPPDIARLLSSIFPPAANLSPSHSAAGVRHGRGWLAASASRGAGLPIRVLLIEDNAGDRELVSEYLSDTELEHVLSTVGSLVEAVARLREEAFDVVLLDLHLPDGFALDALARVQAAATETPVVVLTGLEDDSLAKECLAAGADDYIPKASLSPEWLERAIAYACARAVARGLRRQLEHADRLTVIGKLAVTVAHEINNPTASLTLNLGSLSRFLAALATTIADHPELPWPATVTAEIEPQREAAADCELIVDRITNIVKNLRSLAHSGEEQPTWVNVGEVCRRVCSVVGPQVRQRALLVAALSDVPNLFLPERKLEQVLVNLLVNATQAVTNGPIAANRVEVSTRVRDAVAVIRVEDTGCGIPAPVIERIFDPFFSTKGELDGTGLGLSVSSEIIASLGGRITVTSEVGKGSVFEVLLPLVPVNAEASSSDSDDTKADGHRRRVLLIDDDAALTRALQRALGTYHQVQVCNGGAQALELLTSGERFDAVLCDLVMPEVDGKAVFRFVEQFFPELLPRLVFVSGAATTPQLAEFVRTRNVHVIAKPAPLEVLLETIEHLATADAPHGERPKH